MIDEQVHLPRIYQIVRGEMSRAIWDYGHGLAVYFMVPRELSKGTIVEQRARVGCVGRKRETKGYYKREYIYVSIHGA